MKNVIVVTLLLIIGSVVVGAPVADPMPENPIVVFDYQVPDCEMVFTVTATPLFEFAVSETVNDVAFEKFATNDTSPSNRLKRSAVTKSTLQEFQFFHAYCLNRTAALTPDLTRWKSYPLKS